MVLVIGGVYRGLAAKSLDFRFLRDIGLTMEKRRGEIREGNERSDHANCWTTPEFWVLTLYESELLLAC